MTETAIGWTDQVWNPVTGCSKVSEGCRNCYAETISLRYGRSQKPWAAQYAAENVVLHPDRLSAPLKWKKPARCFVNSMSDLFHDQVPDAYIDQIFAVMASTPQHTYQILTKRPERMAEYATFAARDARASQHEGGPSRIGEATARLSGGTSGSATAYSASHWPLPNVWFGTSVEDQRAADERIPHLLRTPAAVRFLSCEPLLGPVDLTKIRMGKQPQQLGEFDQYLDAVKPAHVDGMGFERRLNRGIDWVIVGGESGPKRRAMDLEWASSLIEQCRTAGIAVYTKQDSGQYPGRQGRIPDDLWIHEFPETLVLAR